MISDFLEVPFPPPAQPLSEEQQRIARLNFASWMEVCSKYTPAPPLCPELEDRLWAEHYDRSDRDPSDAPGYPFK